MPRNAIRIPDARWMALFADLCGGWPHYIDMISDAQEAENWEEWHWPVRDTRGYMYIFSLDEHLVPDLYILTCTPASLAEAGWAFRLWRELQRRCWVCVAGAARLWRRVARAARPHRRQ